MITLNHKKQIWRSLVRVIKTHIASQAWGTSIGCLGALAEFQDPEAYIKVVNGSDAVVAMSPRGAVRIEFMNPISVLAYEAISTEKDAWQCGVAFVADESAHNLDSRSVLRELGKDCNAVREEDLDGLLFDIGVGMPNVDFCIRTRDADLIAYLREYVNKRVVDAGHPALEHIIETSPHRIVISPAGRIEVYQRIDRHKTPHGPHTHLLPDLLAKRRTHSANIPIPKDSWPILTLHPENPLFDHKGRRRPFSEQAFENFESILAEHGKPEYVREKFRIRKAINDGTDPKDFHAPTSRLGRLAIRIALRQLIHVPPPLKDPGPWIQKFGS